MNYENEIKKIKESIIKLYDVVDALIYEANLIQSNKPFKVGDRVQFKTWEEMEKEFGVYYGYIQTLPIFNHEMKHLCGTYATIKEIDGKSVKLCDFTENYGTTWCYSLDMLKHTGNEPKWVFTEEEKVILRNASEDYEYITRDNLGNLELHTKEPYKKGNFWDSDDYSRFLFLFNNIFKCIQWTDEEPCEFRKYI